MYSCEETGVFASLGNPNLFIHLVFFEVSCLLVLKSGVS
jgi:hypothetical protein